MSRSTQWVGLNDKGSNFVFDYKENVYDYENGLCHEEIPLYEYNIENKVYREVVQEIRWSSGPMFFVCLEDEEKNKYFEWKLVDNDWYFSGNEFNSELGEIYI